MHHLRLRQPHLCPQSSIEAAKLKEVAVLQFDGPDGKDFSNEIEGTLASINIHDKQFFTLVDRMETQWKALNEMQLSQSAIIDPDTAAKVGKMVRRQGYLCRRYNCIKQ